MQKKWIFIISCMMLFIPVCTNAASVTASLNCPSSAKASAVVNCTIKAKPVGTNLSGLQANLKITNGTYQSLTPGNGWTAYSNSKTGFSFGRNKEVTTETVVGTIKIKMPTSGSLIVSLTGVVGSDKNYSTLNGNSPSATIRVQSTNNNLKSLSISNGTLSPTFNANTMNYTSTINATSVTINASAADNKAKISGAGTKTLKYGANTFNIAVTSESGAVKTYKIVITRPDNRSSNNNLVSLSTNRGTITFNKNTTTYNLNVDSNVSNIQINGAVEDQKASFIKGFGPRTVNLNYGKNVIQIKVQAENTAVKIYTINVNRKDDRSTNNYLKELNIDKGTILFNKNNLEYSTTVYYDVTKLNVTAVAEDAKSTVTVNSPNLLVGNNLVTIVVKAENGSTRTYKITVVRYDESVKMSDNNNVESLNILGHNIDFKTDVLEYDLTIKDEYALVFEVSLEDPKANYIIEGNKELKDGSVIKVITKSESGLEKEYKFNVQKEKEKIKDQQNNNTSSNNMNILIYTIIGFVLGVLLTLIITKIINNKKINK